MKYIKTVKENGNDGYFINGTMSVPKADGNRHYRDIQAWIRDGGIVEPFETEEEQIIRETKELENREWTQYLIDEQAHKKQAWINKGRKLFKPPLF